MTKSINTYVDVDVDIEFEDIVEYIKYDAEKKELLELKKLIDKRLSKEQVEEQKSRCGLYLGVTLQNYGEYYELENILNTMGLQFSSNTFLAA